MNAARALCTVAAVGLVGAGTPLDSQYVLQRYAVAIASARVPKVVVYSYTVSQVGSGNIEQHHRIYRSGLDVRDETLSVDGIILRRKIVRFSRHEDRYSVGRFAPSASAYQLLFIGTLRDGRHLDYEYEATPLSHPAGSWIDRISIDGTNFLPRRVHFQSGGLDAQGSGQIEFGAFGNYWLPIVVDATAHVKGKPARERIAWSDYRFPASLPPSTFQAPQPLPHAALPPI